MSGAEGHKDCKVANDLNAGHKNGESVHDHSKRRSFFHPFPHFHLHSEKKSIAESGPFILEKDPQSGHYICRQNDHWPNEDSWKRMNEHEGAGTIIAPSGVGMISFW